MNPQTVVGVWGVFAGAEHPNCRGGICKPGGCTVNPQTPLTSTEKESSGHPSPSPKSLSPPQKKKVQVTLPERCGRTDPRRAAGEQR